MVDIVLTSNKLPENSATGTVIGTLQLQNTVPGQAYTIELTGASATQFRIDGSDLVFDDPNSVNFEQDMFLSASMQVLDGTGAVAGSALLGIDVVNENEAPVVPAVPGPLVLPEDLAAGTDLDLLLIHDPDHNPLQTGVSDPHTLTLVQDAGGLLAMTSVQGNAQISLAPGVTLDFETMSGVSRWLEVRATDSSGLSTTYLREVIIADVAEAPTALDDSAQATAGGITLIDVTQNDSDPDGIPLTGANGAVVQVHNQPTQGSVAVIGTQVQYTAAPGFSGSDSFTYTVFDNTGLESNEATVTIGEGDGPTGVLPGGAGSFRYGTVNLPDNKYDIAPGQGFGTIKGLNWSGAEPLEGALALTAEAAFIDMPEPVTFTVLLTGHVGENGAVAYEIGPDAPPHLDGVTHLFVSPDPDAFWDDVVGIDYTRPIHTGTGDGPVTGSTLDEILVGTGGNDVFMPGGGYDVLVGAGGNDTVNFDGDRSDYSVYRDPDGTFHVFERAPQDFGAPTAEGEAEAEPQDSAAVVAMDVEVLEFADGDIRADRYQVWTPEMGDTAFFGADDDIEDTVYLDLSGIELGVPIQIIGGGALAISYGDTNAELSLTGIEDLEVFLPQDVGADLTILGDFSEILSPNTIKVWGTNHDDKIIRDVTTMPAGQANTSLNVISGKGYDTIKTAAGNDVIDLIGISSRAWFTGEQYTRSLFDAWDALDTEEGKFVEAGAGDDVVGGWNRGKDTIYGEAGNDLLEGSQGGDVLFGGPGDDTLKGEEGEDYLEGGGGDDELDGGIYLMIGPGLSSLNYRTDTSVGGTGSDTIINSGAAKGNDGVDVFINKSYTEQLIFDFETTTDIFRSRTPITKLVYDPQLDLTYLQFPDLFSGNGVSVWELEGDYSAAVVYDTGKADYYGLNFRATPNNDTLTLSEDTGPTDLTAQLLANDTDPEGNPLSISDSDEVSKLGAAVTISNGQLTYDPSKAAQIQALLPGQTIADSFDYKIWDGFHESDNWATVKVTIQGQNDPIVFDPNPVQFTGYEGQEVTFNLFDPTYFTHIDQNDPVTIVTVNGSDTEFGSVVDPISGPQRFSTNYDIFSQEYKSSLEVSSNGDVRLVFKDLGMDVGETYTEYLSFYVQDGFGSPTYRSMSVLAQGVNDAPTPVDDTFTMGEDDGFVVLDLLANDTDPNGDALRIVSAHSKSTGGQLSVPPSGDYISFAPTGYDWLRQGMIADHIIEYAVEDIHGDLSKADVKVTVTGENDPLGMAVTGKTLTMDEDGLIQGAITVRNQFGANTGSVTEITLSDPDTAQLQTVTITPRAGGEAKFSFDITQTGGTYPSGSVYANAAPTSTFASDRLEVQSFFSDDLAAHAAFNISAETNVTGTFVFDIEATDGFVKLTDTLTIHVKNTPDAPDAADDVGNALDNQSTSFFVLTNDSDVDPGDTLTLASIQNASAPFLFSIDAVNNAIVVDPVAAGIDVAPGQTRTETVEYTVTDADGLTDTATLTVALTSANSPIVVNDDLIKPVFADQVAIFEVQDVLLGNDYDPDGNQLSFLDLVDVDGHALPANLQKTLNVGGALVTVMPRGALIFNPDGQFDFLAEGDVITHGFTYTLDDQGLRSTATATVEITGVNDAPVAADDSYVVVEDAPFLANVLTDPGGADMDPDVGDSLTVVAVNGRVDLVDTYVTLTNGARARINAQGVLDVDTSATAVQALDDGDSSLPATLTYTVSDGSLVTGMRLTDTAQVSLVVAGTNDAPVAANDVYSYVSADSPTSFGIADGVLTNDLDPDKSDAAALHVVNIAGTPLIGGTTQTATLVTGAEVTMHADGSFTYDPKSKFNLPAGGSATDTFAYTLSDGDATATGYAEIKLFGHGAAQTISGGASPDFLQDSDGGDALLVGLEGDDTFMLKGGLDTVIGGEGTDTVTFAALVRTADHVRGTPQVALDLEAGTAIGDGLETTLDGVENAVGSGLGDQLKGDAGTNLLIGLGGRDVFVATEGGDQYLGGSGRDKVSFELWQPTPGNAQFIAANDFALPDAGLISGIQFNPLLAEVNTGLATGLTLRSIESTRGTDGLDILIVTDGKFGNWGEIVPEGRFGNWARPTDDGRFGNWAHPTEDGRFGNWARPSEDGRFGNWATTVQQGRSGDDIFVDTPGTAARINGGKGLDIVSYALSSEAVELDLSDGITGNSGKLVSYGAGAARGDSFVDVEGVVGSVASDRLTADKGANLLVGLDGDDFLFAGRGNDTLHGGRGNDLMEGGRGRDTALFDGALEEYTLMRMGTETVMVVSEADGIDTLDGIEVLIFADDVSVEVALL